MIKALSLAAALAVLPVSAAVADPQTDSSEAAIEAAAERFEARMEAFGERAEVISEDKSLTEEQRELRIATLWAEYQPDLEAFTSVVSQHAASIAAEALANVDVEAIVAEAMSAVEESGALTAATGFATNGAWASGDPEHIETMMLPAQYAMSEAMDAADAATQDAVLAATEAAAEAAEAAAEASAEQAEAAAEAAAEAHEDDEG